MLQKLGYNIKVTHCVRWTSTSSTLSPQPWLPLTLTGCPSPEGDTLWEMHSGFGSLHAKKKKKNTNDIFIVCVTLGIHRLDNCMMGSTSPNAAPRQTCLCVADIQCWLWPQGASFLGTTWIAQLSLPTWWRACLPTEQKPHWNIHNCPLLLRLWTSAWVCTPPTVLGGKNLKQRPPLILALGPAPLSTFRVWSALTNSFSFVP